MLNARVCLFVNGDQVITQKNDWKGASSVAFFSAPYFSAWLRRCPKRVFVTTVLFTSFIRQGLHQTIFFRKNYLGYLESQACAHKNNPRTHIQIHSIYFLRLLNQNLRTSNQTETFLFRIHASACKRPYEPHSRMFRVCHESGRVPSSVNLALINRITPICFAGRSFQF